MIYAQTDLRRIRCSGYSQHIQRFGRQVVFYLRWTTMSMRRHRWVPWGSSLPYKYSALSFNLLQPIMIASRYLYLPLLLVLAPANSVSTCLNPAPPPQFLPDIRDCLSLSFHISYISSIQRDIPQVWSSAPTIPGYRVRLPYIFSVLGNNCEVMVDTAFNGAHDMFPTRSISVATNDLVSECLAGHSMSHSSLGNKLVGPRQRILVFLRKNFGSHMVTGKNNTGLAYNGTELAVMEVAANSGANLTSTE